MSEILIQIDGKEVKARPGMTVLEAAQKAGISIPTLCYHEKLAPFGGCRLCIVEVDVLGSTKLAGNFLHRIKTRGANVKVHRGAGAFV
ncbi:2Fe-2S iron-sulfur cluster-binding protein, partial [candidate division CSSED10-310 bacterium]